MRASEHAANGNLADLLRTHMLVSPDRQALVTDDRVLTFAQLDDAVARASTALQSVGVRPSDRVIGQVTKSIDNVIVYLATVRVGAVWVPLNTAYTDTEVGAFIDDAEPALVIRDTDDPIDAAPEAPIRSLASMMAMADASAPMTAVEIRSSEDLAAICYTSGTTGRSKGAMLTHANLASNALALHSIWRFSPGDVLLHILPIFHVHGLFVALHTALLNASTILFETSFDADRIVARLPDATVMMGVPTHYRRLLDHPGFDQTSTAGIRLFTSGSAPMMAQLHAEITARTGHRVLERYGMTEGGMITSNPYDGDRVPGTVGFALPQVSVRTRGADGELCGPGEAGVVEFRGPNQFAGYWKLPERTEAEHTDDGWFVTGDVGTLDAEGRLTLEGRSSDMIISGGLNVYPKEIEQLVDDRADVVESAVIGVADGDLGERVEIVLVCGGAAPSIEELRTDLEDRLARFKHPRRIHVVDALPRNAMGKVQKTVLRDRFDPSRTTHP